MVAASSEQIRTAFNLLDVQHRGSVSRCEMIKVLRQSEEVRQLVGLPQNIKDDNRDQFEHVFQAIDTDKSNEISLAEFEAYFESKEVVAVFIEGVSPTEAPECELLDTHGNIECISCAPAECGVMCTPVTVHKPDRLRVRHASGEVHELQLMPPDPQNPLFYRHRSAIGSTADSQIHQEGPPAAGLQMRILATLRGKPAGSKGCTLLHKCVAELVGTCMIVIFGVGCVNSVILTGAQSGLWQVAVVWGFGVALAIYCTASSSGAHLNPAVSLAFALLRPEQFAWSALLPYMLAQLLGGVLGGAINLAIFNSLHRAYEQKHGFSRGDPASVMTAACFGEYFPNPGNTLFACSLGPHPVVSLSTCSIVWICLHTQRGSSLAVYTHYLLYLLL